MRFRMVFFAFVISLCAIGAGNSHAGWIGTCNPAYVECVTVSGTTTVVTPCSVSNPTTTLEAICNVFVPVTATCHPSRISCYCTSTGSTQSFETACSSLDQTQLNAACDTQYGASACPSVVSINSAAVVKSLNAVVTATASGGGITERGFFWWNDTQSSGLIPVGYGAGDFTTTITNLPANTKIFISAYIRAAGNLITAGNNKEITTGTPLLPTVITKPDFTVNGSTVIAKGEITDVGSSPVTIYGFVYATHPGPTVWDMALPFTWDMSLPISQGKAFEGTIKGLAQGQYYFRAYAHNTQGTTYGEEYAVTVSGKIDAANKYAWSENAGWLNFDSQGSGVTVFSDHLEGYVWHENAGWIRLGTFNAGTAHTYTNTSNTDYGVNNDGYGNLSGYGWSENAGWINFRAPGGGVSIDRNGIFSGYAWAENMGWIKFANTTPAYKVVTQWTPGVATYTVEIDQKIFDDGKGTVSGAGNYVEGAAVTLTPIPDADSVFVGWLAPDCKSNFNMPAHNMFCTAMFFKKIHKLSVIATGNGNGTLSGAGSYEYNAPVKPAATASTGSKFAGWTSSDGRIDCAKGFNMPVYDVTCTAIFDKLSLIEVIGVLLKNITVTTTVQGSVSKTRDNATGGNAFMSWQFGSGVGTFLFKKPVSSVTVHISDNSGDTTLTAYGANDVVLKTVTVSGSALQSYTINNVGGILKVVVSSSNAYIEDVSYDTEIVPGDTDFDGDAALTDTIIMLKILAGADFSETIYPEISLNRQRITLEDVIVNLQKVAGLR